MVIYFVFELTAYANCNNSTNFGLLIGFVTRVKFLQTLHVKTSYASPIVTLSWTRGLSGRQSMDIIRIFKNTTCPKIY